MAEKRFIAIYEVASDGTWIATCPELGAFEVRHDTQGEARDIIHALIRGRAGDDVRIEDRVL